MATKLDKLDQVIKKASREAALACAQRVTDELTWRAKECIAEFYDEYEPKYYDRWGQLEKTPHEIIPEKVKAEKNIEKYIGGVSISSSDMQELYNISAENVFDLAVGHGYHGLPGYMSKNDYIEGQYQQNQVKSIIFFFFSYTYFLIIIIILLSMSNKFNYCYNTSFINKVYIRKKKLILNIIISI